MPVKLCPKMRWNDKTYNCQRRLSCYWYLLRLRNMNYNQNKFGNGIWVGSISVARFRDATRRKPGYSVWTTYLKGVVERRWVDVWIKKISGQAWGIKGWWQKDRWYWGGVLARWLCRIQSCLIQYLTWSWVWDFIQSRQFY